MLMVHNLFFFNGFKKNQRNETKTFSTKRNSHIKDGKLLRNNN